MHRLRTLVLIVVVFGCADPAYVRAVCGDGLFDPDYELCDDGVANGTNGCCTTSCTLVDADGDGVCDAQDPCASPAPLFADATLLIKGFATEAADDAFRLTGILVPGTTVDPASDGFAVILRNEYLPAFVRAAVPGGFGWRSGQRGGWSYRDSAGSRGGVTSVTIKPLGGGRLALTIKGRRRDYARSTDIRPIRVAVALAASGASAAACGETFLALSRCRFGASGNTLRCTPPAPQRRCPSDPDGAVRCDAQNAAAAQDAYFTKRGTYYSGDCGGLPDFTPSAGVACTTIGAGDVQYTVVTSGAAAEIGCVYSSLADHPGDPSLVCH